MPPRCGALRLMKKGVALGSRGPSTEIGFTLMLRARRGDRFPPRRALKTVTGPRAQHARENSQTIRGCRRILIR